MGQEFTLKIDLTSFSEDDRRKILDGYAQGTLYVGTKRNQTDAMRGAVCAMLIPIYESNGGPNNMKEFIRANIGLVGNVSEERKAAILEKKPRNSWSHFSVKSRSRPGSKPASRGGSRSVSPTRAATDALAIALANMLSGKR